MIETNNETVQVEMLDRIIKELVNVQSAEFDSLTKEEVIAKIFDVVVQEKNQLLG